MSKLPVVSGTLCVKALGKIGFVVTASAAAISPWCEPLLLPKPPYPITRKSTGALCDAIIRQAGLTVEEFLALL